jgi:EmrB/QacA subfamily drug resistance transporter
MLRVDKLQSLPTDQHKWWILANVSLGTFMATLDGSIANVALPTIASIFHVPIHLVQWVLTAYLLTICALLPIIGKLSDLFGRSRIYNAGFLIFTAGSALCGISSSLRMLILSRVLQAVGAACLMANSQAIVAAIFAASGRGRAMGIIGTVVSIGSLTGPALGGLLVGSYGWPSIFWINIPVGIIGFLAALFILPKEARSSAKEPFDYIGSLLFMAGMVFFLYTTSNGEVWGWSSNWTVGGLVVSAAILIFFYFREKSISFPMLDFSLYRIRGFAFGNIAALLSFVALFCTNVMLPFYMQNVLQFSPEVTGYTMMAFPVTMALVAPISGWLSDKFGPYLLTTGGLFLNALGFGLLNTLTAKESPWLVAFHLTLFGLGAGMFQSPNNSSVMGSVPKPKLGIAGGLNALVRNIGMVLGISLSVSLFSFQLHRLTGQLGPLGENSREHVQAMMSALHLVFWAAAGVCIVGAIVSSFRENKGKNQ